jgi:hypothetical protein
LGRNSVSLFIHFIGPSLFGTDVDQDLNSYEAVVNATHRYKEMFYGGE